MGTNYTLWRKGRLAPDGDGKIDVCLKCGRKGAVRFMAPQGKRVRALIYVIHQKRVLGPSPFGGVIWDAFDRCFIPIDEAGKPAPAEGNSVAGSAADHPDLDPVISGPAN